MTALLSVTFQDLGLSISFISISVNSHEFQICYKAFSSTAPPRHNICCLGICNFSVRNTLHYIQITIISILIEISKVCDCTAKSTKHFSACQNLCILEEECTFLQVQINLPNFFRLALKFSFHKKRGTD